MSQPHKFDYLIDEVIPMEQEWFDNESLLSEEEMNDVDEMYRLDEELEDEFEDDDFNYDLAVADFF